VAELSEGKLEAARCDGHNRAFFATRFLNLDRSPAMSLRLLVPSALVLATACVFIASPAAGQGDTFTDPAQAGPDFAVQGEYATGKDSGGEKHAAQVIALGGGKFELVHYFGGLPGDGWKRGDRLERVQGETKDGTTVFKAETWTAAIKDGAMTVTDAGGAVVGKLARVERKSPTLGAKPPEGAIVLFDGTSADNFTNGKLTPEGHLMADCESKQKFGDHVLHVEFRTPFKPAARGQARGNSGVYIHTRYELQVLDSFGLDGKNNECGGIYSIAEPIVNMCYPPLAWQTYDIDFKAARYDDAGKKVENARVTIHHNGVVIHDNLELPKGTPGKNPEGPGPGGVYLQGHGNPVVFANIWVVEKK
jgi:hypothetical protein